MQNSDVIQSLTGAELSMAERKAGLSIATLEDPNFPKIDLLGALAWVHAKREDANLKFEFFMSTHTLEQITGLLGLNEEDEDAEEGEGQEA